MEVKYFSLGAVENSKPVKIIQVAFGIVCIIVAIYWVVFSMGAIKTNRTIWITIAFLLGFGFYMIWAGLGKATRFIEISQDKIRLKKTILLPAIELMAGEIKRIEVFPFNLAFFMNAEKRIILRLSSSYYETNAKIKDEIMDFAEAKNIDVELKEEKL
jgi:hypothetical protein